MLATREAIFAALDALVYGATTSVLPILTHSRVAQDFANVSPENQPALFMNTTGKQIYNQTKGVQPLIDPLPAIFLLYVNNASDPLGILPATMLGNAADAIQNALAPEPASEFQTLGGLVSHAWIESIEVVEGLPQMQTQSIAIITINMEVA